MFIITNDLLLYYARRISDIVVYTSGHWSYTQLEPVLKGLVWRQCLNKVEIEDDIYRFWQDIATKVVGNDTSLMVSYEGPNLGYQTGRRLWGSSGRTDLFIKTLLNI